MANNEELRELIDRWEDLHENGADPSVEQLCADRPHLAGELRDWIDTLKASDWLNESVGGNGGSTLRACVDDTSQAVLGEYTLLAELGSGGMGKVYKALHRTMDRLVAIKVLPESFAASPQAVERFHREIRAVAKLSHPNIVAAYDAGCSQTGHFLAMELVEGRDLARLVEKEGPVSVEAAVDYTLQAAHGLAYAHSQSILHRDIKPSNLIFDMTGCVKILDLGLARLEDQSPDQERPQHSLTDTGSILGTVSYMAPEQALNTKKADHRADIYSLGCTLYFLLTGKPPYEGETPVERLLAHREQPIPSLKAARPETPVALEHVFRKMVAKQPDHRFQSMDDVMEALEAARIHTSKGSRRPTRRTIAVALALLGVMVVLGAWIITVKTKDDTLVLRVEHPNAIVQVQKVDSSSEKVKLASTANRAESFREAATWIIQSGGHVGIQTPKGITTLDDAADLPQGIFTVADVVLQHNRALRDDDLEPLSPLTSVQQLMFGNTSLTGTGLRFVQPNERLYLLLMWDTMLTDEGLAQVARFTDLLALNIGNNYHFTDEGLRHLTSLRKLESLELGMTNTGDVGLRHVAKLEQLRHISLHNTKITDAGLAHLKPLRHLESLHMQQTGISDAGLTHLERLPSLNQLRLDDTRVTELGVQQLQEKLPDCSIQWETQKVQ